MQKKPTGNYDAKVPDNEAITRQINYIIITLSVKILTILALSLLMII